VLWKLERFDEALTDLNEVLTDLPDAAPLLVLRGRVLLQLGRMHEAASDFDRVLQLDPKNAEALHGRAVVLIEDQQPELAMSLLDAALRIAPEDPNSLLSRARLLWDDRELRLAEADLSKLLTKSPNFIPAIMFRAEIRLRQRRFEDSLGDYDHVIQDDPENATALVARSIVHELLENPENAQRDLRRAAELFPEAEDRLTITRLLLQASLAFENEHYTNAIRFVEEVLALQPENHNALRCRAASHWFLDQFVEALHDYDLLLEIPEIPDQPRAGLLISRGAVLGELGEFDQALEILLPAVAEARRTRGKDLARGLNALGRTLTGLERFAEADEAFRESLSMEPENAWLHFNRGLYFLAQGQRLAAGKCFSLAHHLTRPPLSPRKRLQAAAFIRQLKAIH
jgi:tetratricopeptide (TPR) repeat protein